jgi:hypothetical protein
VSSALAEEYSGEIGKRLLEKWRELLRKNLKDSQIHSSH